MQILFFSFDFLFFFIAKIPRFICKQKNHSCEKNLGQIHSGLFFFGFFFFGLFVVPNPIAQKFEENQKKNKKIVLREESWVNSFRIVFFVFL